MEYICDTCPISQNFKSRITLKQLKIYLHEGSNDVLKFCKFIIYLTKAQVNKHYLKRVLKRFPVSRTLIFMVVNTSTVACTVCRKVLRKNVQIKNHARRLHKEPSIICPEFGEKKFNRISRTTWKYIYEVKHDPPK